ncbi:glycoside hydrolase family 2 TIM barrel-domain containing protein [Gayadomonas joobiniege]|uniref:glycoside hydrolase family 2 TIM barrel-domain containing protein n=1 Tax=Gayadomonas joobiniege TaxID=1234606 RepID=UPI0003788AEC|nr:glycoside hydrolase family 2 TIM barrel-domain containing protein [Gayadomonas joobiniege]
MSLQWMRNSREQKLVPLFFVLIFSLLSFSSVAGERASFNQGWKFKLGDDKRFALPSYDDTGWQSVTLPHDWAIAGPFDPKYNARTGGLPHLGTGWYRKTLTLSKQQAGKRVRLSFDGAMQNARLYVNGELVGYRPFGYVGFHYDITEYLKFNGQANVIAVKLFAEDFASRWYPGAGIYRDTWLEIDEPLHIAQWGTFVTTPSVNKKQARVAVKTEINNLEQVDGGVLKTRILDAQGQPVASAEQKLNPNQKLAKQDFTISNPHLWGVDNPYLYRVESKLYLNGQEVDRYYSPLGIRDLKFTPDNGFFLNGERVQIQGVCLHHDNGPLGAVANRRAIERKLQIMKKMGANAVRTSHNPPSPILVELADKMGILLQVEAFDVWKAPKRGALNSYNKYFDEWHEKDLRAMIKQHRNNPSIIMWSTGNEIMEQAQKDGWKRAKQLTDIAKDEDPTRLVAAGFNHYPGAINNKLSDQVDIVGLNYKPVAYQKVHQQNPDYILLASETSSVTSTRGAYHFPALEKGRKDLSVSKHDSREVSSYDYIGPPWAYPPDIEFYYLDNNPQVMGEFVWTGFDYLGEPTPYGGRDHNKDGHWNADWPVKSSFFGIVDLVGLPKDRYYLYQSQWSDKPMVHVLPHWNWPNKVGESIPVLAYTNAEAVELFVNGKSMGKKRKGIDKATIPIDFTRWDTLGEGEFEWQSPYRLRWDVEYQPGEIEVVAYTNGKVVARKKVVTADTAYQLSLNADREVIQADGQDLSYITVEVKDKKGHLVPDAEHKIRFFVEGGEIAGVGNGDQSNLIPFNADYTRAFYGKAVLIVKSKAGRAGKIKVRAFSSHLQEGHLELTAKP